MPKRKFPAWSPAALAFSSIPAFCAGEAAPLENIVVTASRIAVPAAQVGSSVTVLSRATLDVRRPTFVADALRDVPGVTVSRGGGYGAVTQARIRGAEGNHTLVLIDGVEANNPVSSSEFDFANLPAGDIERIEVLRGPQSALYGSDAIGGVINVITRGPDAGFDARVNIESGNLGTHAAGLAAGGGNDRASGRAYVARLTTAGENIARFGDERDGFASESLRLDGRLRVGDVWSLRANAHVLDSEQSFDSQDFDFPPAPTQGLVVDDDVSSRLEQVFASVEANADLARTAHRLRIARTTTANTFLDAALFTGRNEGDKTRLDYQATIELGPAVEPRPAVELRPTGELRPAVEPRPTGEPRRVVQPMHTGEPRPAGEPGADDRGPAGVNAPSDARHGLTFALERELVDYSNVGATRDAAENQERDDAQTSIVAEYRRAFERGGISVGARYDENDLFDDAATYRISGTFAVTSRTRVHGSVGTGVANPGFYELFGFFPGSFTGNPTLSPEHSTSFDVGLEHVLGPARVDLTYFRADLEDEIVTVFDQTTFLSSVANLRGESERRGVELSLAASPTERWDVAGTYTYSDARQPDGLTELRRPRHVASLDNAFELAGGRARLNVGIDYTGRQHDNELVFSTPEERIELEDFVLVAVAASLDVAPRMRLYARIENALDERYEEWFAYRGRGRAWILGFETELGR